MHQIIARQLEDIKEHLPISPTEAAWIMTSGRFQRLKCAFGTEVVQTPWLTLDIPQLESDAGFPDAQIFNGQMRIPWEELQNCFDTKIDEISALLDGHIRNMYAKFPDDQITYTILSGGFGSSPYVRQRLLDKYNRTGTTSPIHPNADGMQILVADELQLVVVHGLVLDRIQQIKKGVVTFGSRCSPVSYGIVCDKIYDPDKHIGESVRLDPRDKKTYARDQIDWLMIQGSPIPYAGLTKPFQLKMDPGREEEPWNVQIVMSHYPLESLPRSVQRVCNLNISTENVDKKLKNRHWYNMKPTFWRTTFDVKVVVGPADLSFQLWSKDKRIRNTKHEPIGVKWMPADKD
ncbi:hypothetical protein N7478_003223 [Penicillium angulare]|uniref:uncharacterized protein n=1 Tax=Penicillium angulare TaxID=116970 RepID=UPI00254056CD|nr:uncharacterized protein N7478_003223 [Penicillium angulare]KAJ5287537.1 hypothetical protein N7478_003223 [Penicillium angulare]